MTVWADKSVQGAIGQIEPDVAVLAEYEQSHTPALLLHKYGQGYAVHINFGTKCGPSYAGQNRFVSRDESWEDLRQLVEGVLLWSKASRPLVALDPQGHGIPQVNATLLQTEDKSIRYIVAYSDYRQEHSQALDLQSYNGANDRVQLSATDFTGRQNAQMKDGAIALQGKDAFAEAKVKVPADGRYQVWLEVYFEKPTEELPNALTLSVDGRTEPPDNASGPERLVFGNTPNAGRWLWQSGRSFDLTKGSHTLRLTAIGSPLRIRKAMLLSPPALATRVYLTQRPQQAFDVYAEKELPLAQDTRGTYVPLYLQPGEGKVISLLPYKASPVSASPDRSKIKAGESFTVAVSKTTPGTHSMRLTISEADGREIPPPAPGVVPAKRRHGETSHRPQRPPRQMDHRGRR